MISPVPAAHTAADTRPRDFFIEALVALQLIWEQLYHW